MKLVDVDRAVSSIRGQPKLHLLGNGGAGTLELKLVDGTIIKILFEKRYARLLLFLSDALRKDHEMDERERGWLTNEQIADMYGDGDPRAYIPEPSSFSAYRSHINRKIRKATEAKQPGAIPPTLFITIRNLGVRLVRELEIVQH